jgi:glyoxylate reductase
MKIFISAPIHTKAIHLLENAGHSVKVWDKDSYITHSELLEKAKDADALITMLSDNIDEDFLRSNTHLKVITNYAVGHNNINSKVATELGIAIGNTPDVLTEATADLALSLLMNVSRMITQSNIDSKNGKWKAWEPLGYIGKNIRRKTLGIIGAGRIGQHFATTCAKGFDMNVIYTSRSNKSDFENSISAKKVQIEELLKTSDVISIHCDLNDETNNLINKETIKYMKESVIIINTSRGAVINEDDLLDALNTNKVWAAGLDVTNPEPMHKDSPLMNHERVLITPHIGSATDEAREMMSELVAKNIINALECKSLAGDVNKIFD